MNISGLINMVVRMFMRKGINKGIQVASRRGKKPEDMTPDEIASARNAQQTTQNARRGMNVLRRFMR